MKNMYLIFLLLTMSCYSNEKRPIEVIVHSGDYIQIVHKSQKDLRTPEGGIIVIGQPEYLKDFEIILLNYADLSSFSSYQLNQVLNNQRKIIFIQPEIISNLPNYMINSIYHRGNDYSVIPFDLKMAAGDLDGKNGSNRSKIEGSIEGCLAHEFQHFLDFNKVSRLQYLMEHKGSYYHLMINPSEVHAVRAENYVRLAQGLNLRTHYNGVIVFPRVLIKNSHFFNTAHMAVCTKGISENDHTRTLIRLFKKRLNVTDIARFKYHNQFLVGAGYKSLDKTERIGQVSYSI